MPVKYKIDSPVIFFFQVGLWTLWSYGMLQILIPNYTINHCKTESSTAFDSEDEKGNMVRGQHLKFLMIWNVKYLTIALP